MTTAIAAKNRIPVSAGSALSSWIPESPKFFIGTDYSREYLEPNGGFELCAWRTVSGQTVNGDNGYRNTLNTWFRSSSAAGTQVTGEVAAHDAAYGTARDFQPSRAFVVGTETVYVNGSATTAYSYADTGALPNGSKAAGQIIFSSAPANGASITFTYTTVPGFAASCAKVGSGLADIFDVRPS
jgi:hypothetical protein